MLNYIAVCLFAFLSISFVSCAQKSPRITIESDLVKVSYGQPSKRGRVIFGELVPYGKVWRTGANEATEITFTKDVVIADKEVKAGTYSLFTIPNEKEWTIILNASLGQWGAYEYDKIKNKDVLQFQTPVNKLSSEVEKLDISFKAGKVEIAWDKTSVAFAVTSK